MDNVIKMIKSGELNVLWDGWLFAGGHTCGDQTTYSLLRNGKKVGYVQENLIYGYTIELDGCLICDEFDDEDFAQRMEGVLKLALRRDDKELMNVLNIKDNSYSLPCGYCDFSREEVLNGALCQV